VILYQIDTIQLTLTLVLAKNMKDIEQRYQSLLGKESDYLERERRKEYEHLFDDLARQGMVRADLHTEQALELEVKFMQCFTEYAIAQYRALKNYSQSDMNMLERMYRNEINSFFGRSLQRMLGIISNVRGSVTATYAQEFLEEVKSHALQALETAKAEKTGGI